MADQSGLRERKKAATKAALSQAALRLTLEKGLDAVSPDDIAAEAGVSTRTFHNYFQNKEDALLHDFNELTSTFVSGLRENAKDRPIWDAIRDACIDLRVNERFDVRQMQCREEIIRSSPSLITHQAGQFMTLFSEAVGIIAEATGTEPDDLYPRLVCGTALVAMKVANEHWLANPDEAPLPEVIAESFAHLEAGIASHTNRSNS